MNMQRPSCALVIVLIATQILVPAALWAAEQSGVRGEGSNRVLISAVSGEQLTAQSTSGLKTLHFRDTVGAGDQIATGGNTVAEVLIGHRAVVTLGRNTTARLTTVSLEQTTIQVTQGIVRVAASAPALGEQGRMIIQTPTVQVQTRGGIVRVMVNAPVASAEQPPAREAKPYLTSYAPTLIVATLNTRGDIIQVEAGTAKISGAGPDGEALSLHAGQSVTLQSGQADAILEFEPQETMHASVLAKADHTKTPKEGLEHLVALQVDQATQLGQALTSTEKTGQDESENIINGATGGVQVANTVANTIVNTLFGGGNAFNPVTSNPTESTGSGFSGPDSNTKPAALGSTAGYTVRVNGGEKALLVFTKKDPVEPIVIADMTLDDQMFKTGSDCGLNCISVHEAAGKRSNIDFPPIMEMGSPLTIPSEFTVERELVLLGGKDNNFHGGIAPTERLIVRGVLPGSNVDILPTITGDITGTTKYVNPPEILEANSTFVFRDGVDRFGNSTLGVPGIDDPPDTLFTGPLVGGILGQFANDSNGPANTFLGNNPSDEQLMNMTISIALDEKGVTGAITATGSNVVLTGGVTLDRETVATIGTTTATNNYFNSLGGSDAKFTGSLLSVIHGPDGPTALTVQDRLLGVYDGSQILKAEGEGNKALLSILDAKLKGPSSQVPLIDIDAAFMDADINNGEGSGSQPTVTVTSALVTRSTIPLMTRRPTPFVTRSTIPLDGALLEASAPLLALTQAMMTTTSHFADLAGNLAPSIKLDDALIALNASQLLIQNGHLLNLNDATATMNGYLFSLNNGSQLQLNNGTLFSLNNGSSLNLNANAFGVFGSGTNTLNITNNLCAATCGTLVNSANTPFMLNESPLQVAGVTQNVVLPNSFNVFAAAPNAQPVVNISQNAAVFQVDSTSTLTINGTAVVKP